MSGHDILIVAERFDCADLDALSEPIRRWQQDGNPLPQLFTLQELLHSADVFPIELMDLQHSRRILFGRDPLAEIKIDMHDYRVQIERELKTRFLLLRRKYVAASRDETSLAQLMIASISTFLVLLRGVLRLYNKDVPAAKAEALDSLRQFVKFDPQPFHQVLALKQQSAKPAMVELHRLFGSYLAQIETVIAAVDRYLQTEPVSGEKPLQSE